MMVMREKEEKKKTRLKQPDLAAAVMVAADAVHLMMM